MKIIYYSLFLLLVDFYLSICLLLLLLGIDSSLIQYILTTVFPSSASLAPQHLPIPPDPLPLRFLLEKGIIQVLVIYHIC